MSKWEGIYMKRSVKELYQAAIRLTRGRFIKAKTTIQFSKIKIICEERYKLFSEPLFPPLLEEYAAVIGEETELECRHFFE